MDGWIVKSRQVRQGKSGGYYNMDRSKKYIPPASSSRRYLE